MIAAAIAAGAFGAVLRYLVTAAVVRRTARGPHNDPFPWAVLIVNVVGSGLGGVVVGAAIAGGIGAEARLILVSGLCGGLTTFSTLGVETVQLWMAGRRIAAVLSVSANLLLGIAAAAAGYLIAR